LIKYLTNSKETSRIEWIKIKGFRNLVAHDYFGIDAEGSLADNKNQNSHPKV
jgi:uncharacterized protein with HEPN domain